MKSVQEQIEERIAQLKQLQSDLDWISKVPYDVELSPSGYLRVEQPFDRKKIEETTARMQGLGFTLRYERANAETAQFGEGFQVFRDSDGHEIDFVWPVWREGATCKRVKIGEQKEDVYELVCNQAAVEAEASATAETIAEVTS